MKLYKYQPFGPHTGLNMLMLLKEQAIFFPHQFALNDPTDCNPHFNIPDTDTELSEMLKGLLTQERDDGQLVEKIRNILKELSEFSEENSSSATLLGMLNSAPSEAREILHDYYLKRIGQPRVLSLSKNWNSQQMWAHYAGAHSGFCLEFDATEIEDAAAYKGKVGYSSDRPTIFIEDLAALNKESPASEVAVRKIYQTKSLGWQAEEEYRLVSTQRQVNGKNRSVLSLPNGDFIYIPQLKFTAIKFGSSANDTDMRAVGRQIVEHNNGIIKSSRITNTKGSYDLEQEELILHSDGMFRTRTPKLHLGSGIRALGNHQPRVKG